VAVGKLYTVSKRCGSWQAVWQLAIWTPLASCMAVNEQHTVGKLYTAGELCGSGQAVWQRTSCVAVGKLCDGGQAVWQWASCVAVGKLCGGGQAVWQWASSIPLASCLPLASCMSLASCVAVGKLCVGSGQAVWQLGVWARLGIRPGVGAGVRVAHRIDWPSPSVYLVASHPPTARTGSFVNISRLLLIMPRVYLQH